MVVCISAGLVGSGQVLEINIRLRSPVLTVCRVLSVVVEGVPAIRSNLIQGG
jgi:hypothetical protein